ncbi:MAG: hypothetical protein M1827_000390 [Pycnora praestabilis]|nr:MAG: hypothetical protein M1827_000390 [Pycnora praestabilis]
MSSSSMDKMPRELWRHPDPQSTAMWKFMQAVNVRRRRSRSRREGSDMTKSRFWQDVWEDLGIIHGGRYTQVVDESARMDSIPAWFHGVTLNFAENILYTQSPAPSTKSQTCTTVKEDSKIAVTEVREGVSEIRHVSWGGLRSRVGKLSQAMRVKGVKKGDRVAVVASNSVDTLVVFLAVTALGGLFSSSSTDMGVKGVLDRLLQIKPKYLFMDDWAVYNGKTTDLRSKMTEIVEGMRDVAEFQGAVSQPRFEKPANISKVPRTQLLSKFLSNAPSEKLEFEQVAFQDPFLIVYSSGTTGTPKCIVHSAGGVILSSKKEGRYHRQVTPNTVALQYTTTGWIMYLSSIMTLIHGARVVLFDGSPFLPDLLAFIKLLGEQKITQLGTSPRYLHEIHKNNISPREVTDLSALKIVTSTGMVLADSLFEWFYDVGFPSTTQLANISGGTDIAGCFALENPLTPVYVGGCQGPSLGIPIEVYDSLDEGGIGVKGKPVEDGVPGELVATGAFPNMPVMFWGGSDAAQKYFDAYYARFDDVWTHGDFIMVHPLTKGLVFLGRADGVLNPSGVRFGSAEVYGVLESEFPQLADSICIGQRRPQDVDETVLLFVMMKPGHKFSKQLVQDIKTAIRIGLSARHVPKYIFETPDIPTTVNLKKVELPVKQIVSGKVIQPSGTLLNPDSLNFYYQFAKVEELVAGQSKL